MMAPRVATQHRRLHSRAPSTPRCGPSLSFVSPLPCVACAGCCYPACCAGASWPRPACPPSSCRGCPSPANQLLRMADGWRPATPAAAVTLPAVTNSCKMSPHTAASAACQSLSARLRLAPAAAVQWPAACKACMRLSCRILQFSLLHL